MLHFWTGAIHRTVRVHVSGKATQQRQLAPGSAVDGRPLPLRTDLHKKLSLRNGDQDECLCRPLAVRSSRQRRNSSCKMERRAPPCLSPDRQFGARSCSQKLAMDSIMALLYYSLRIVTLFSQKETCPKCSMR